MDRTLNAIGVMEDIRTILESEFPDTGQPGTLGTALQDYLTRAIAFQSGDNYPPELPELSQKVISAALTD